jgi:hypothetical protein
MNLAIVNTALIGRVCEPTRNNHPVLDKRPPRQAKLPSPSPNTEYAGTNYTLRIVTYEER